MHSSAVGHHDIRLALQVLPHGELWVSDFCSYLPRYRTGLVSKDISDNQSDTQIRSFMIFLVMDLQDTE